MKAYILVMALTQSGLYTDDYTEYHVLSPYPDYESCSVALRGATVRSLIDEYEDNPIVTGVNVACADFDTKFGYSYDRYK